MNKTFPQVLAKQKTISVLELSQLCKDIWLVSIINNVSFAFFLDSPKNVTVSVSPSGPVVENSNVTLTCNSDANPAEQNYTWHGVDGSKKIVIGNEKILNIIVSTSKKRFFCMAENVLGEKPSNISDIDVLCMYEIWLDQNHL